MGIEIDRLDLPALVCAPLDKVSKVAHGVAALLASLHCFFAASVKLFERTLQTNPQRVGWDEQHLAGGARDTITVGVRVVHGRELG